ncbi:bumetanide-sensitive sodium-(potassium)-chloride cotransporter-like [Oppia nitens]|uniref:bumetanide-sensitive sodium-(potassium)-chloride cotransporter-like n=1 Tax=Oppia nitens TaxID=1686743 RepID=UPI0023D9DF6C|nr:bumetanide-sensitive sodium-(potassium)-chloride cotransporter-like [Oppia nitens]
MLKLEIHELKVFDSLDSPIDKYQCSSSDVTPKVENYLKKVDFNHQKRPTLLQLHQNSVKSNNIDDTKSLKNTGLKSKNFIHINDTDKFGYFTMVYIPTFMNLLGGTLYLRMGIMAGQAGIILSIVQILMGTVILVGTVLSLSALCTNGQIGCGGFYYLISRNLGPEIGAVFGIIYFITNVVLVSQSLSGICTEIQYIFQAFDTGLAEYPSGINDMRIVGLICLAITAIIPFISLELEAKTQWILFIITVLSLLDFFVGTFLPTTPYQKVNGFIGFNAKISFTNLLPQWNGYHFLSIFGIYMSALCGDFTGVTMSSSLKNPKVAIPKGSLLAVFSAQFIYIIQIILFACAGNRYATGKLSDYPYGNYTCDIQQNCESGISKNQFMMSIMSALTLVDNKLHNIEPIYVAGLLAQGMSSSLCSFITAPRILQSLGFDNLLPGIGWFSNYFQL